MDRLCAAAETRGINIIRDKQTLRTGDPITPFMSRIGRGDRVFVILSEKYLHSAWCMFELSEIWFQSRLDEGSFAAACVSMHSRMFRRRRLCNGHGSPLTGRPSTTNSRR